METTSKEDTVSYRLWVSEDRRTLIRIWENGVAEAAFRVDPYATWGPPVKLVEEKT